MLKDQLASTDRGILLLSSMVTDWDISALEWKKVLQIIKDSLPKAVKKAQCHSKLQFENISQNVSIRPRAKTWHKIRLALTCMMQEFFTLEPNSRKLVKKIDKLLKPKTYTEGVKHGLNWELQMRRKPNRTIVEFAT